MTLDDAINYYDGIAKEYRANADIERNDYMDLRDGAFEAEQLASWLNELKLLRERIEKQPEPCEDMVSRQAAIDAIEEVDWYHQNKNKDMVHGANSQEHQAWYKADDIYQALITLPSAQLEIKPIDYQDCANAMLRMWMDEVVTDGEYNRIVDKLNAFWRTRNERSD